MLVAGSAVVAEVDGFPLIVRDFRAGNTDHIELCLRFPQAAFSDIERALATSDAFASAFGKPGEDPRKILKKRATISQDNVRIRFPIRSFSPSPTRENIRGGAGHDRRVGSFSDHLPRGLRAAANAAKG